jgi:1,4-alpha-glucan branching enzyme
MGFTHLELLPINEHRSTAAGATTAGMYAPTRRFWHPRRVSGSYYRRAPGRLNVLLDW